MVKIMGLSITDRFGTAATIDTTTPSDPKLIIKLNSLKSSSGGGDLTGNIGIDTPTTLVGSDADKIATALILLWRQKQPSDDTSPTIGVYVGSESRNLTIRGSVSQLQYSQTVYIYTPDPTTPLDPDNVVV